MKRILVPRRPDLRVIVSLATLETDRFAAFFGGAPVVQVVGAHVPGRRPPPPPPPSSIARPRTGEADLAETVAVAPSTS